MSCHRYPGPEVTTPPCAACPPGHNCRVATPQHGQLLPHPPPPRAQRGTPGPRDRGSGAPAFQSPCSEPRPAGRGGRGPVPVPRPPPPADGWLRAPMPASPILMRCALTAASQQRPRGQGCRRRGRRLVSARCPGSDSQALGSEPRQTRSLPIPPRSPGAGAGAGAPARLCAPQDAASAWLLAQCPAPPSSGTTPPGSSAPCREGGTCPLPRQPGPARLRGRGTLLLATV